VYFSFPGWLPYAVAAVFIVGAVASVIWSIEGIAWLLEHVEVIP
jgi:hypothetical protein